MIIGIFASSLNRINKKACFSHFARWKRRNFYQFSLINLGLHHYMIPSLFKIALLVVPIVLIIPSSSGWCPSTFQNTILVFDFKTCQKFIFWNIFWLIIAFLLGLSHISWLTTHSSGKQLDLRSFAYNYQCETFTFIFPRCCSQIVRLAFCRHFQAINNGFYLWVTTN